MTLTSVVLCLVVMGAGADEGEDEAPRKGAVIAAPEDAVKFDELPPPPKIDEDRRVKRFLGALAGGAVGFGGALAMTPLGDAGCGSPVFGPCFSGGHAAIAIATPLVTMLGAWIGFRLAGGEGGLATPMVAMLPAGILALLLSVVANQARADTGIQMLPYTVAAGLALIGGSALALEQREETVEELGAAAQWGQATAGRVTLEALVSGLTMGTGALLTGFLASRCFDTACVMLALTSAGVLSLGSVAATWGVHRAMGGRGSFAAGLVGLGLGAAFSFGAIGVYAATGGGLAFNPLRNTGGAIVLVEMISIAALFAPLLALEFSHTALVKASLPKFSLSAAPTAGGGVVGASFRF